MKVALLSAVALALTACTPSGAPAPAPAPAPRAAASSGSPSPALPGVAEAQLNWHLLDATADGIAGISALRAERELLKDRQPQRVITVAVIDGGVDTAHTALKSRLWLNADEIPGNGSDDDNNGYVDDVRGWNFIGGKDGKNVAEDTYEVTRLAAQCTDSSAAGRGRLPARYRDKCPTILAEVVKKHGEAEQTLAQVLQIEELFGKIIPILKRATGSDSLTSAKVSSLQAANDTVRQARQVYLGLAANGISQDDIVEAKKAYGSRARFGFNTSFNPRGIVGDDYPDTLVKSYGNRDVMGPDASHGTHVAGIIGSLRDAGGFGIATNVRIMGLRAVPDGDERDKDVANAIRYAVDNGAHIINMSFGKAYSPYKSFVDDAVRYADSKGVLMVHAAGNDAENTGESPSFPTPEYAAGGRAVNWIEVGASSWKGRDSLVASFSNYSRTKVDLFAPGDDIYSTIPGGGFKQESGTSMASPVVTGVAALLMSYFPNLTAAETKRIILESSTRLGSQLVARPGESGGMVRFSELSATGGIINVFAAVQMARKSAGGNP
ncbi:MAG: S8 family peptidase [Gemmatimonadota bacterium]